MHSSRRGWLTGGMALWLGVAACAAGQSSPRSLTFSLERLQAAVAKRFPRSYSVQRLLDVSVQAPLLSLLPAMDHIGAQLSLSASGPLLQRDYTGQADVDFALRYEPSDRSLRATELNVNALRLDDMTESGAALLQNYLADAVRKAVREVVVYRLGEDDLRLADTLGLQPGAITVTGDGLRVELVAAPR